MAAFLVPLQAGACVIPLEKAILLIGRQADCDVSLTTSRKISRKHCCIAIVNDSVVVRDLGSTNGVSINGQRIDQEGRIRLGDELSIGDVRFRLQKDVQFHTAATPEQVPVTADPAAVAKPAAQAAYHPVNAAPPPSLDFPVAIPDDRVDFLVEQSSLLRRPYSEVQKTESSDSGPLVPLATSDEHDVVSESSENVG